MAGRLSLNCFHDEPHHNDRHCDVQEDAKPVVHVSFGDASVHVLFGFLSESGHASETDLLARADVAMSRAAETHFVLVEVLRVAVYAGRILRAGLAAEAALRAHLVVCQRVASKAGRAVSGCSRAGPAAHIAAAAASVAACKPAFLALHFGLARLNRQRHRTGEEDKQANSNT